MEKELIRPRSFGTHDGSFHADEVTACALLLLFDLIDQEEIVRSRNLKELSSCEYVCDVGVSMTLRLSGLITINQIIMVL